MSTIDQLAPATAASDADEFLVSQGGIVRKVTRAQILAGVQPQVAISGGQLLGRQSAGTGGPEQITVGANLGLNNGTLSARAAPFVVASLPTGVVPSNGDIVPLAQGGNNTAVTYGQFMSGLTEVANVDVSKFLVTPTGSKAPTKLADLAANTLPLTGGTLTGALTLAATPSTSLQAATKTYVDTQVSTALPKSGGTLSGALTLASDPAISLQAATKQYVDGQVATSVPKAGGTISGTLTLAGNPSGSLQAATKQYVDARVLRSGDTLTGPLVLAADPTAPLQAATKEYVDSQFSGALPKSGGTLIGALTLAADPTLVLQAATKHYVDGQVAASLPISGGTLTGALALPSNPSAALQAATKQYVDSGVASAVPVSGGTLTGVLTLAADPLLPLQAATKHYVDTAGGGTTGEINVRSSPYNAKIDGVTDDTAAFKAAYQAAAAGSVIYVPNGVTVVQNPTTWGIPLTKRVKWIVDGTSAPDGTSLADAVPGGTGPAYYFLPGTVVGNSGLSAEISQNGSQPSDFAVLHSSYIVNHVGGPTGGAVIANTRNDTIIYNSPNNFVWGGIDRLLWCGTQTPTASSPAQHVSRYIQTIRQNIGIDSSGKPLPQPDLWTACLEYRDTTGQPSSWAAASLTVEMDWFGNGPDDANARQIQSLVVGRNNTSGAPVEISSVIGVYLAGGSTGHAYSVFNVNIPFSKAALDTTGAQQMAGAAAIRLAAGHSIAFEPTNSCSLAYDSTTNTLRWNQGVLSYAVGKGITVGWMNVFTANATLPNWLSGNLIFLAGSASPYTITLPAATTVAAGTGFTFSVLGSAVVTIAPTGSDTIDNGPITLRPNDRYHVISDANSSWHDLFRSNTVNPHFSGTPVLASYTVSTLPLGPGAGAMAFACNGRKPGEVAGAGTGVGVFYDGSLWISVCGGTQVLA
jgi:Pectate lyase superfamily protein